MPVGSNSKTIFLTFCCKLFFIAEKSKSKHLLILASWIQSQHLDIDCIKCKVFRIDETRSAPQYCPVGSNCMFMMTVDKKYAFFLSKVTELTLFLSIFIYAIIHSFPFSLIDIFLCKLFIFWTRGKDLC